MGKMKVAIDCRELTREHLGSFCSTLLKTMEGLSNYQLVLISDTEIPACYVPEGAICISRGKRCNGGADLVLYQLWMKKAIYAQGAQISFQINHFSLVPMRDVAQITVVHDLYPLEKIERIPLSYTIPYRLFLFATMVNSKKILTVSEFSKKRLEHFFWKSNKIEVNLNGVDTPLTLDSYESPIDGPYILMLGRVCYWKRTLRVAELYDQYLSNSGYKLVIAGQGESDEVVQKIKTYTEKNPNIIWMNYVDNDVRERLMRNTSLLVYASRYDGFGLPPLELALRRRKVLMSDIEVLREVSQDKGEYVDFDGPDEVIVNKIKEVLEKENPRQIEQMYQVAKSYTWDRNIKTICKCVQSVGERKH